MLRIYKMYLEDPNKHLWDFDENGIYNEICIDGFYYKVLKSKNPRIQKLVANKLHEFRKICNRILKCLDSMTNAHIMINYGVDLESVNIFNDIHTDNYELSQMKPGTGFDGLNKPKDVIMTTHPKVGPDGSKRAQWRDIFLTIDTRTPYITKEELDLFIHELAHTGPNHVTFRTDDHGTDFQCFEELLSDCC